MKKIFSIFLVALAIAMPQIAFGVDNFEGDGTPKVWYVNCDMDVLDFANVVSAEYSDGTYKVTPLIQNNYMWAFTLSLTETASSKGYQIKGAYNTTNGTELSGNINKPGRYTNNSKDASGTIYNVVLQATYTVACAEDAIEFKYGNTNLTATYADGEYTFTAPISATTPVTCAPKNGYIFTNATAGDDALTFTNSSVTIPVADYEPNTEFAVEVSTYVTVECDENVLSFYVGEKEIQNVEYVNNAYTVPVSNEAVTFKSNNSAAVIASVTNSGASVEGNEGVYTIAANTFGVTYVVTLQEYYSYTVKCVKDFFTFTIGGTAVETAYANGVYTLFIPSDKTDDDVTATFNAPAGYTVTSVKNGETAIEFSNNAFTIDGDSENNVTIDVTVVANYTVACESNVLTFSNNVTAEYTDGAYNVTISAENVGDNFTVTVGGSYVFTGVTAAAAEAAAVADGSIVEYGETSFTVSTGDYAPGTTFTAAVKETKNITIKFSSAAQISVITNADNDVLFEEIPATNEITYDLNDGTTLVIVPATNCAVTAVDGATIVDSGHLDYALPITLDLSGVQPGATVTVTTKYSYNLSGVEGIEADNNGEEVIYNLQGVRVNRADLPAGLYIVNGRKQVIR